MTKQEILSLINEKITENNAGNITATELNRVLTEMLNETPLIVTNPTTNLVYDTSVGVFPPTNIPDEIRPLYDNYLNIYSIAQSSKTQLIVQDGAGIQYLVMPVGIEDSGDYTNGIMLTNTFIPVFNLLKDDAFLEFSGTESYECVVAYIDSEDNFCFYNGVQ
jgi:hypothetical protein